MNGRYSILDKEILSKALSVKAMTYAIVIKSDNPCLCISCSYGLCDNIFAFKNVI